MLRMPLRGLWRVLRRFGVGALVLSSAEVETRCKTRLERPGSARVDVR